MLDSAKILAGKYLGGEQAILSDALWAFVMNLQAAANAKDHSTYSWIKEQMQSILKTESVAEALEKGLLRTTQSNDYPAWAMAKTYCAARMLNDNELCQNIESFLVSSIDAAKNAGANAEYILAELDYQLAVTTANDSQISKLSPRPSKR